MKEFVKKNKLNIIIILLYAVITFIILLFHEPWRDEAQSWLIARDLNVIDIIKQMQYEGHPYLWYLILVPFAKLGAPYFTVKIISWLFVNITAWLILKKSPFDTLTKIIILMTAPFLYLYPAISRSYCIIPLAITLICMYYNKRHEHPVKYVISVLLLAYTHVIMYGMVGMLLLLFFIEEIIVNRKTNTAKQKKVIWLSLLISILILLSITIPIILSTMNNTEVRLTSQFKDIKGIDDIISRLPNVSKNIIYNFTGLNDNIGIYIVCIPLLILLIYEIEYYPKNALIFIPTILFQFFIYSFIYFCSPQRAGTLILLLMFLLWIQTEEPKQKKVNLIIEFICMILFVFSIIFGIIIVNIEIKYNYSSAKETAEYINEKIDNGIFICADMPCSSAVIPYVNKNIFWSPSLQNYFSYTTWNEQCNTDYTIDDLKELIKKNFNKNQKLYLLYSYNWKDEIITELEDEKCIETKFVSSPALEEQYIIFEIKDKFRE